MSQQMHTPKRNDFQPTQQEANFSPANTQDEPLPGSLRAKGPANLTSSGGHKRRHGPVTTGSGRGRSSDTLEHKYTPQLPSPGYSKVVEGGRVRWVRIGSTPEVVGGGRSATPSRAPTAHTPTPTPAVGGSGTLAMPSHSPATRAPAASVLYRAPQTVSGNNAATSFHTPPAHTPAHSTPAASTPSTPTPWSDHGPTLTETMQAAKIRDLERQLHDVTDMLYQMQREAARREAHGEFSGGRSYHPHHEGSSMPADLHYRGRYAHDGYGGELPRQRANLVEGSQQEMPPEAQFTMAMLKDLSEAEAMARNVAKSVSTKLTAETLKEWVKQWRQVQQRFPREAFPESWLATEGPTYSPPDRETTTQKAARNTIADALILTVNKAKDPTLDRFFDTIDKTNPQTVYRRLVQRYSANETEQLNKLNATIPSLTMKATAATVGEYGELWVATVKSLEEAGAPAQTRHWIKTYLAGLLEDFDTVRDEVTRELRKVGDKDLPTLADVADKVRRWAERERADRALAKLRAPSSGVNKTLVMKIRENVGVTLSTFTMETNMAMPANCCRMWWSAGTCRKGTKCRFSHALEQKKAGASSTKRDFSNAVCSNCNAKGHTKNYRLCPKHPKFKGNPASVVTLQSVPTVAHESQPALPPAPPEQPPTPATSTAVTSAELQRLTQMMNSMQAMIAEVTGVVPGQTASGGPDEPTVP